MIELVIKIPEEDYKFIKDLQFYLPGRRNCRLIEFHVINAIKNSKPYEERSLYIEDVFRLVAGHNIYSGDDILSVFSCLSEGKDVKKPIEPLDISYEEIADLRRGAHNE